MLMTKIEEQAGYLSLVRACLKQQTIYLQSLETSDMFTKNGESEEAQDPKNLKKTKTKKKSKSHPAQNQQGEALKATLDSLKALHGKLYGDMAFGKREVAWGKLDAKDIDEIFTLFRGILIPLIGMRYAIPTFFKPLSTIPSFSTINLSRQDFAIAERAWNLDRF
jgi:hypothetical protein